MPSRSFWGPEAAAYFLFLDTQQPVQLLPFVEVGKIHFHYFINIETLGRPRRQVQGFNHFRGGATNVCRINQMNLITVN